MGLIMAFQAFVSFQVFGVEVYAADLVAKGLSRELGALINTELWCERTQFYHDRTLPQNFVAHKTAAGFKCRQGVEETRRLVLKKLAPYFDS